jgi:PGF-CTERM protein
VFTHGHSSLVSAVRRKSLGRLVLVSFADKVSPAPREVRLAGLLTALPGVALLVLAVIVAEGSGKPAQPGNDIVAEVAFYVVLAAGVLASGTGLLLGRTWARSPAVVIALLTVGAGWYAAAPSGQPGFGVPAGLVGVGALLLLFRRPSRAWMLGQEEGETEEEAAERGGAAGRAARRDRQDD